MRGSNAGKTVVPASLLQESHTVGQAEIQISRKLGCPAIRWLKIKAIPGAGGACDPRCGQTAQASQELTGTRESLASASLGARRLLGNG